MPVPPKSPRVAKGSDLEQVLTRLKILEQSLMCQVHDKLAKSVAKQVVEELRGSPIMPQQPLRVSAKASSDPFDPPNGERRTSKVSFNGSDIDTGMTDEMFVDCEGESEGSQLPLKDYEAKGKKTEMDGSMSMSPSAKLLSLRKSRKSMETEEVNEKVRKLRSALKKTDAADHGLKRTLTQKEQVERMTARKDTFLDLCVGAVIILNAVIIGISMDNDATIFHVLDVFFTLCFLVELGLRFQIHGVVGHFSQITNCFDFVLVFLDVSQLVIQRIVGSDVLEGTPSASLFRIVRLARLTRLTRLARLHIFDDLVAMITGIIGGMWTLVWSMVLLALIVYITSLVFREFYGNTQKNFEGVNVTAYFDNVPRAMLTVFRYFFGDFSTADGTNLFEAIQSEYGALHGIFVVSLFFVISVGVFNVIASIFVESTLEAALAVKDSRKTERMNNEDLWNKNITELVRKFFEYNGCDVTVSLHENLDEYAKMPIDEASWMNFMKDRKVKKALRELEISEEDHKYLFDILDADNLGELSVTEMSDGVERLRGDPRRSDIICIDLMVRSLMEQANFLVKAAEANMEVHASVKKHLLKIEHRQSKFIDPKAS